MFATCATMHNTNCATSIQLVFDRNETLNVQHEANWHFIKEHKQVLTTINNTIENKKQKIYF